jgi:phytoene synthase
MATPNSPTAPENRPVEPDAGTITRAAKSNLAFALACLPKERRRDTVTFYAFCRTIDDLADDEGQPVEKKAAGLAEWREGIERGFPNPTALQASVTELRDRYQIPTELFSELIRGCEMDLRPQRFGTWQDLSGYTHRVACVVGLISLYLFGCKDPESKQYAVALGHALQLTNILRDVAEDLANGVRIYLPLADLARFQYTERDLIGRVHDGRFLAAMNYQADRAEGFFQEAGRHLTATDRSALVSAEIMREIYHTLLDKMRADGFRVFDRRYRLSRPRKLAIFSKKLLREKFTHSR